jgi:hypothetical protein
MKNRLARSMMVLATIAMVVSLVAALTPDASAQDSGTAPVGPAKWMRHNIPAAPDLQAACCPNIIGVTLRNCCIRVSPGPIIPGPDAVIGSESAAPSTTFSSFSRWFCIGFTNGNHN